MSGVNSDVSLVPTVATELDSDDGVSADESPHLEGRRQDNWPAAEYYPRDNGGGQGGQRGRSVEDEEDGGDGGCGGGGGGAVVGQYVEISSDDDSFGSGNLSGSGSGAKAFEDVERGYQASTAAVGAVGIHGRTGPGKEVDASEGEGALLAEEEGGSWLARKLRLRLPSKGDMLIYGGFLLNVSTKGTISCFETIGAQYAMTNFSLSSAEVRQTAHSTVDRLWRCIQNPFSDKAEGGVLHCKPLFTSQSCPRTIPFSTHARLPTVSLKCGWPQP